MEDHKTHTLFASNLAEIIKLFKKWRSRWKIIGREVAGKKARGKQRALSICKYFCLASGNRRVHSTTRPFSVTLRLVLSWSNVAESLTEFLLSPHTHSPRLKATETKSCPTLPFAWYRRKKNLFYKKKGKIAEKIWKKSFLLSFFKKIIKTLRKKEL